MDTWLIWNKTIVVLDFTKWPNSPITIFANLPIVRLRKKRYHLATVRNKHDICGRTRARQSLIEPSELLTGGLASVSLHVRSYCALNNILVIYVRPLIADRVSVAARRVGVMHAMDFWDDSFRGRAIEFVQFWELWSWENQFWFWETKSGQLFRETLFPEIGGKFEK